MTGIVDALEKKWARAMRAYNFDCGGWQGAEGLECAMLMQDVMREAQIETRIEGNKSEIRLWCADSEEYFWPLPGETLRHEAMRLLVTEHEIRKQRGLR